MAKIALELDAALKERARLGAPGRTAPRLVAHGEGWTVADVVCTSGPQDRPFEEAHGRHAIAIVVAGTFEYRSELGDALMTPGSLMLCNADECFECGHSHGRGDRCVSFWFSPEYFERLAADAGARGPARFQASRIPPLRSFAPVVATAAAGVTEVQDTPWEELAVALVAKVVRDTAARRPSLDPPHAAARVSEVVRAIERHPDATLTLGRLARMTGLSPFYFLRSFQRLTGVTPHQFILRARLREAALALRDPGARVVDVALDCGFGDVSNFNHAFRAEFGAAPRSRRQPVR